MAILKECDTLINVEGKVYKLTKKDYRYFKDHLQSAFNNSNTKYVSDSDNSWSNLLHWVEDNGEHICNVETYNY